MTHTEETRGLPSCSGLERLAICPGSWLAERGLPDLSSEDSTFGDRVHARLAGSLNDISAEEQECAEECVNLLIGVTHAIYGAVNPDDVSREERLWFHDDELIPRLSGKADVTMQWGTRYFIADFKTGRVDTDAASRNMQLRGLAMLLARILDERQRPWTDITVAIIAPNQREKVTVTTYTREDIERAQVEILAQLQAANQVNAPRIPSEKACRYCKAKGTNRCPESQELVAGLAIAPPAEVTVERLAFLLDRCGLVEDVIDAIRATAKRRIEAGEPIPGWQLKPGVVREKVTDVQTVFARLNTRHGVTVERFTKSCSITKKELDGLLREAAGLKGKAVAVEIEAITEGCVESKQASPSLERVA